MKWVVLLLAVITQTTSQDSDGYTDENRPYKFAFNIEGYQHRSEEKDENGIIKGEYGFVTGDGVYHMTVYATDENGNFRIISMKNFYIGLPNEPTTSVPMKTTNPPSTTKSVAPTIQPKQSTIYKLDGVQGCGGCRVPTTTTSTTSEKTTEENVGIDIRFANYDDDDYVPEEKFDNLGPRLELTTAKHQSHSDYNIKGTTSSQFRQKQTTTYETSTVTPQLKVRTNPPITNNLQNDDRSPNIQPGEPSELLYEFNQTQTYQGHHEKGFRDSSKHGDYFINGRDGVRQVVEYIADSSGYQPHIRFQNISPMETPNPDTEKLENVLKGIYFKWFYKK